MLAASEGMKRVPIANGLITFEIPEQYEIDYGHDTKGFFSREQCFVPELNMIIRISCGPVEHKEMLQGMLDHYESYMFALSGPNFDAYEREIFVDEPLSCDLLATGARMRNPSGAFNGFIGTAQSKDYFYTFAVTCTSDKVNQADMDALLHSFAVDERVEYNRVHNVQEQTADGRYVSINNGLTIAVPETWNIAEPLLGMDTVNAPFLAFGLEKSQGVQLIQFIYAEGEPFEAGNLLDYLRDRIASEEGIVVPDEEIYELALPKLGIMAQVFDVVTDIGIHIMNVAFVYNGVGYFGFFMHMDYTGEEGAKEVKDALLSIAPAEGIL